MGRRIALLFPGQASQYIGMGRLAAEHFSQAREVFERIDDALSLPISRICFTGTAEELQETRWQQPAIFACSMAFYAVWQDLHKNHDDNIVCAAGHSLGEYSALVAAGALTLEVGARLVAIRGRAMQEAANQQASGMSAILGLQRSLVEEICATVNSENTTYSVVVANDNTPVQQVISGNIPGLEVAARLARERGARKVIPLQVAGAFHSAFMKPAVEQLEDAFISLNILPSERVDAEHKREAQIQPCRIPVVANSTVTWLESVESIHQELVQQITAPVRWVESVQMMATQNPEVWIDVGPGNVMVGMLSRILPKAESLAVGPLIDAAT